MISDSIKDFLIFFIEIFGLQNNNMYDFKYQFILIHYYYSPFLYY